ncbi:MAG: DUF1249 domain-containing protein [Halioglobus sp.]
MSLDFQSSMLLKNTLGENGLHVARKKSYKLNLSDLHAVCEANYVRLLRLFPDYETSNSREFMVGSAKVRIEVVERCRYTTFFRIHQYQCESPLLGDLRIDVRAYHDARMLEVGTFQSRGQIAPRYAYPNEDMYQQDEKSQQNRFLADWLEHCHHSGHVSTPVTSDQPPS